MKISIKVDNVRGWTIDEDHPKFFIIQNARLQTKTGLEIVNQTMLTYNQQKFPDMHSVLNLFDWYSVTLNKYVLLISKVFGQDHTYRNEVMPFCKDWRNKVAAHYSFAAPKGDNQAMQNASVFQGIRSGADGCCVGGGTHRVYLEDGTNEDATFPEWNLVKEHVEICKRYFED